MRRNNIRLKFVCNSIVQGRSIEDVEYVKSVLRDSGYRAIDIDRILDLHGKIRAEKPLTPLERVSVQTLQYVAEVG